MNYIHIIIDLENVKEDICSDDKLIVNKLLSVLKKIGLNIVSYARYHLGHNSPPGYACIIMLERGHCSAHSYADKKLVALDFYIEKGKIDEEGLIKSVCEELQIDKNKCLLKCYSR